MNVIDETKEMRVNLILYIINQILSSKNTDMFNTEFMITTLMNILSYKISDENKKSNEKQGKSIVNSHGIYEKERNLEESTSNLDCLKDFRKRSFQEKEGDLISTENDVSTNYQSEINKLYYDNISICFVNEINKYILNRKNQENQMVLTDFVCEIDFIFSDSKRNTCFVNEMKKSDAKKHMYNHENSSYKSNTYNSIYNILSIICFLIKESSKSSSSILSLITNTTMNLQVSESLYIIIKQILSLINTNNISNNLLKLCLIILLYIYKNNKKLIGNDFLYITKNLILPLTSLQNRHSKKNEYMLFYSKYVLILIYLIFDLLVDYKNHMNHINTLNNMNSLNKNAYIDDTSLYGLTLSSENHEISSLSVEIIKVYEEKVTNLFPYIIEFMMRMMNFTVFSNENQSNFLISSLVSLNDKNDNINSIFTSQLIYFDVNSKYDIYLNSLYEFFTSQINKQQPQVSQIPQTLYSKTILKTNSKFYFSSRSLSSSIIKYFSVVYPFEVYSSSIDFIEKSLESKEILVKEVGLLSIQSILPYCFEYFQSKFIRIIENLISNIDSCLLKIMNDDEICLFKVSCSCFAVLYTNIINKSSNKSELDTVYIDYINKIEDYILNLLLSYINHSTPFNDEVLFMIIHLYKELLYLIKFSKDKSKEIISRTLDIINIITTKRSYYEYKFLYKILFDVMEIVKLNLKNERNDNYLYASLCRSENENENEIISLLTEIYIKVLKPILNFELNLKITSQQEEVISILENYISIVEIICEDRRISKYSIFKLYSSIKEEEVDKNNDDSQSKLSFSSILEHYKTILNSNLLFSLSISDNQLTTKSVGFSYENENLHSISDEYTNVFNGFYEKILNNHDLLDEYSYLYSNNHSNDTYSHYILIKTISKSILYIKLYSLNKKRDLHEKISFSSQENEKNEKLLVFIIKVLKSSIDLYRICKEKQLRHDHNENTQLILMIINNCLSILSSITRSNSQLYELESNFKNYIEIFTIINSLLSVNIINLNAIPKTTNLDTKNKSSTDKSDDDNNTNFKNTTSTETSLKKENIYHHILLDSTMIISNILSTYSNNQEIYEYIKKDSFLIMKSYSFGMNFLFSIIRQRRNEETLSSSLILSSLIEYMMLLKKTFNFFETLFFFQTNDDFCLNEERREMIETMFFEVNSMIDDVNYCELSYDSVQEMKDIQYVDENCFYYLSLYNMIIDSYANV